jgi:hypothetical protein
MSNPVTYSPQALTNALNKGYFYIGTNDVGKGPTSSTGYFDGVTPSNNQYVIYYYKNGSTKVYYCNNGDQVYVITNRLKSQNFTTLQSALNYIATQGDMLCVNREYEPIVTNGLVLNLDAGFVPSYPMTGSTWYDLSDNDNDGTLTNSPTFSSTNGGNIVFDGTDDFIDIGYKIDLLNNDITQEAWVNTDVMINWHGIISNMPSWGTGFSLQIGPIQKIAAMISGAYLTTSWTPLVGVWYHIVATHRSSDNLNVLYVNGVQENSVIREISYVGNAVTKIGVFYTSNSLPFDGKMGPVRSYNRALTSSEVFQNYNAQKGRFGL